MCLLFYPLSLVFVPYSSQLVYLFNLYEIVIFVGSKWLEIKIIHDLT